MSRPCLREQFIVEGAHRSHHRLDGIVFANQLLARPGHRARVGGIVQDASDGICKGTRVTGRHEETGAAVLNNLGDAPDCAGHDRFTDPKGLEYGKRKSFVEGWKHEYIACSQQTGYIVAKTQK